LGARVEVSVLVSVECATACVSVREHAS